MATIDRQNEIRDKFIYISIRKTKPFIFTK